MTGNITLLHITDPHLLAQPGRRLHGWDVAAAFERVLDRALAAYPEAAALVLGGDLVDDRSPAGYRWLDARLARSGLPVLAIAGNHDEPRAMAEHMGSAVVHGALDVGVWQIIGVSSHRPGLESGGVTEAELARLDSRLAAGCSPAIVCVHHPPLALGSAWLDSIGLVETDALRATLARHARVRGLICGHVHQAWSGCLDGLPIWTTPSTMRQFQPGSRDFTEDTEHGPGYRCLMLRPDGRVSATLHRLTPDTD